MKRSLAGLAAATLVVAGCDMGWVNHSEPWARMVEKGPYQAYYDRNGRLERLLYDKNGDKHADVVTLYQPNGKPLRSEIDSDLDGVVDRWEHFTSDGALEKVARSRRRPGVPDIWEWAGPNGQIVRRESDEDGDGKPEVTQSFGAIPTPGLPESLGVTAEELDTNGNGKPDRRLIRRADGKVVRIEKDVNEDGLWEAAVPVK